MLVRDEPVASVVQEALEGYASGRFHTQADVMRFLQDNPLFPKDSTGIVRHQRVGILLAQCAYAGYVEAPNWGVSLRPGQHEALISLQTYLRTQGFRLCFGLLDTVIPQVCEYPARDFKQRLARLRREQ